MKTLIITGGTGGLGTFVVERLRRNYDCVLLRRDDMNDEQSIRAALAKAKTPYGLVNMAGGYADGSVSETTTETWRHMIDLNLDKAFLAVRETLARINRDEPGRVIAISSAASISKFAGAAAYTISKSALNVLIELTASELAGSRITANALLPDTLDTPASREAMPNARRVPLERVADAIEFLLSDAASNINGALIPLR